MKINELGFMTIFTGLIRGVEVVNKENKDKTKSWTESYVFVEGKDFKTFKFRFTREAIADTDIYSQVEKFIGKTVSFECYSMNRVWNNNIYTDHFYSGSKLPTVLSEQKQAI